MTKEIFRILIVDDDGSIRKMLRAFFEMEGFAVMDCENGEEAIPYCNEADALLTDFNLGRGINGAQLTIVACHNRPNFPAVIMTGSDLSALPEENMASKIVRKPILTLLDLANWFRAVITRAELEEQSKCLLPS